MQLEHKARLCSSLRRLVVKLGSSVVTTASGIDLDRIGRITASLSRLHERGYQIVVVTSGARAAGLARLGMTSMPTTIPEQQAAAAIGQIGLMSIYERFFSDYGRHIGQVLLTASDLENRTRYLNARRTIEHLLHHGLIPVVNENDSVAIEELKFGDNDRLSALVAGLVDADLLVMLTDVDGLFDGHPVNTAAKLIELVENVDDTVLDCAGEAGEIGTGGMTSKLAAARSAAHRGIVSVIANGCDDGILDRVLDPTRTAGTLVLASDSPIPNRKHWIAYGIQPRGSITVDAGAFMALASRGGSLLPSGVTGLEGDFEAGDCVSCIDPAGREFARGLVAYDVRDCGRIKGLHSGTIEEVLGYNVGDEVIHRDDLVLLDQTEPDKGKRS
ncbi:MAG: glutamate 5-kinase [Candidatus Binatia bacterium]